MPQEKLIPRVPLIVQNAGMATRILLIHLFLLLGFAASAADSASILDTAERHIQLQTRTLPGKVTVTMGQLDSARLPSCSTLEAFTPPGSRLQGKTHVGVRCLAPNSWTILIPAHIAVTGNYVTTNRPLIAGQTIQASDLTVLSGDISQLPSGAVSDLNAVAGKTLRNSLGAGQILRNDQLVAPVVIRQNQTVRVISSGTGFAVSAEGKALSNASVGQIVQIRMTSGQTISGTARSDGNVEVTF